LTWCGGEPFSRPVKKVTAKGRFKGKAGPTNIPSITEEPGPKEEMGGQKRNRSGGGRD